MTAQAPDAHTNARTAPLSGVSAWLETTQEWVDGYSGLTGDADWLHNNPQRAASEGPFGGPIVPGFLLLASMTRLQNDIAAASGAEEAAVPPLNYGFDRMRFVRPVVVGRRIRLRTEVVGAQEQPDVGLRVTVRSSIEVDDDDDRPAVVATWLFLLTSPALAGANEHTGR
jgi:acyl dehydratase